jgi:HD-GYP domain-containing protein (c-di-GMP phosphodiesterase class II)/CHASE2 domain-containing sensor protein
VSGRADKKLTSDRFRKTRFIIVIFIGLLVLFSIDNLGFFEGIDLYLYDLSFRIRGPLVPSDRIVIAAIDENTLARLGRWPLDRLHYASLLEQMKEASVAGFDVVFAEATDDDLIFSDAIRRHGRVVLPLYIDRRLNISNPSESFDSFRSGHVHIEEGVDNIVRGIFHTLYYKDTRLSSLSSLMYESMLNNGLDRQSPANSGANVDRILQRDFMKINFYGRPGTFQYISMSDIIDGQYPQSFFRGKAVFVGITAPGLVDMAATPFSQKRNKMPGCEIHANILNNLIDSNAIQDMQEWVRWLAIIVLSILFGFVNIRLSEKKAALLWLCSFAVSTISVLYLFSSFEMWMRPALLYFSFSFLYIATYIFRLDEAATTLDIRYESVTNLIGGNIESFPRLLEPPQGLKSYLSSGGINLKIMRLLRVEEQYEKKLEETIEEKTMELSHALSMIKNMNNEIIMRLTAAAESKDAHTGKHISRIGLYANRLAEAMQMPQDFIENITFASAMHDIGKIGIPNQILLKPGHLSDEEFEVIKKHTIIGAKILAGSSFPVIQMSATIALFHHERWDGTGYPKRLKGNDIPTEARIVMICDIYDALRSRRPYKEAFDHQQAFLIITQGDYKTMPAYFDPDILHAFAQTAAEFNAIFGHYKD